MNKWDKSYSIGRDFSQLSTQQVQQLASMSGDESSNKTFLDVGCGSGALVRDMFHRGFTSHGVDPSDVAVQIARDSTVYNGEKIDFTIGSASNAPLATYDLVACKYVIAFVENRREFLAEVATRMNAHSTLVIITPDATTLPDNKKNIAIDDAILMNELPEIFSTIDKQAIARDWWYVCRL